MSISIMLTRYSAMFMDVFQGLATWAWLINPNSRRFYISFGSIEYTCQIIPVCSVYFIHNLTDDSYILAFAMFLTNSDSGEKPNSMRPCFSFPLRFGAFDQSCSQGVEHDGLAFGHRAVCCELGDVKPSSS